MHVYTVHMFSKLHEAMLFHIPQPTKINWYIWYHSTMYMLHNLEMFLHENNMIGEPMLNPSIEAISELVYIPIRIITMWQSYKLDCMLIASCHVSTVCYS